MPVPGSWFWGSRALWLAAQNPQALLDRAVDEFEQGRFAQSASTFDEVAKAVPGQAPQLWQRGIALYYAGRYADCRRQFESHRTVNPDDVENAAWHFLCVAREQSPDKARAALLPVGPDFRSPMREVYQMFRGALTAEDVVKAAGNDPSGQFYAHLYVGSVFRGAGPKGSRVEAHQRGRIGAICLCRRLHAHGGAGAPEISMN